MSAKNNGNKINVKLFLPKAHYICQMKKAVQLRIRGLVQGVFFRQSTMQKARELGIYGWVRNCEDGSVEVEAEGEESVLKVFINWCHRGPRNARVDDVEKMDVPIKNFESFDIRR